MKTLVCSFAAILSVALSSAVFAASDDGVVTGTVVSVYGDAVFEIDQRKHDGSGNFELHLSNDLRTPKVGEKVRVHYSHCGNTRGHFHCADKIEKIGNARGRQEAVKAARARAVMRCRAGAAT